MTLAISRDEIFALLTSLLTNNFMLNKEEGKELEDSFDEALRLCDENFLHSENKYFTRIKDGVKESFFNPYHSVEHMIFLYYLSHTIYLKGSKTLVCDKIYYLNKVLNSVDLFYPIELPKHFGAEHPLGSVMGRAKYSNGFFFYQGCTVGGGRG